MSLMIQSLGGCRMSRPAGLFLLLPLFVSLSGCLPLRYNTSPGASGMVVDAERHSPIAGAEVVVSELIYPPPSAEAAFTNSRPPLVTTGFLCDTDRCISSIWLTGRQTGRVRIHDYSLLVKRGPGRG
jgi:hypothetical protein